MAGDGPGGLSSGRGAHPIPAATDTRESKDMQSGKLIVFEGIYGSGKYIVRLVNKLREALSAEKREVYEIDSPDSGRAQLMGAGDLDSSWHYGIFKADFFFELAGRARVCSVIREEKKAGKIVLCKNFTLASLAYAQLKGHDWFREDLNVLETRARGGGFGGEIVPDLTIFLDVPPDPAARDLGERMERFFRTSDLMQQRKIYLDELSRMPSDKVKILSAERHEDSNLAEALAAVQALLK
jgi:dTMP kinase